ncbi:MAG: hypothetical protein ABGZ17_24900 [Planctomycetaceae bacterium]
MDVYKEWLGIPDGPRPPDHYELLRLIQFEDDAEKVRAHYKKLNAHVRKYATGRYSQESQDLLNELAKAMLCLTDPDRKRDLDISLGREVEAPTNAYGRQSLLHVLVAQQTIAREQVSEVEQFADARGLSNRDAVVQMKLTDAETASQALAMELGLPFVDLQEMLPDDDVLDRVPRKLVKRHSILPLFVDDDVLLVACSDEPTPDLEDDFRLRFGLPMRGVLAAPLAIKQAIAQHYAPGMRDEAVEVNVEQAQDTKARKKARKKTDTGKADKPLRAKAVPRTAEEKAQRKLVGVLVMCWSTIGSVLVDTFLLPSSFLFMGYLVTLIVPPIVIVYVLKKFWK